MLQQHTRVGLYVSRAQQYLRSRIIGPPYNSTCIQLLFRWRTSFDEGQYLRTLARSVLTKAQSLWSGGGRSHLSENFFSESSMTT